VIDFKEALTSAERHNRNPPPTSPGPYDTLTVVDVRKAEANRFDPD
jgi:hypothetical protein